MTNRQTIARRAVSAGILVSAALLAGCQTPGSGTAVTASDKSRMIQSDFLFDYGRLKPVA